MFNLIDSTTVPNYDGIRDAVVSLLVSDGWINHNNATGTSHVALESPDGQFVSMATPSGSSNNYLTIFFGNGIDGSNNLITYERGYESRYLDLQGNTGRQNLPLTLQLFKSSHSGGDLYVLRIKSSSERLPLPMFMVFGVIANDAEFPDIGKVFIWTGGYEVNLDGALDTARVIVFPAASTSASSSIENRGRLQCRGTLAPGQTTENYTTLTSSSGSLSTSGNGHATYFARHAQPLTNADLTPASGLPIANWLVHIQTPTRDMCTIGGIPDIFYGATPLPDGVVIEKEGRYFLVCRTTAAKAYGCFLMEVPSSQAQL